MSRIHDALKKAESERTRAAAGDTPQSCELPGLTIQPMSSPVENHQTTGTENHASVPSKINWPLNLSVPTESSDGNHSSPDLNSASRAMACEAALLDKCTQYSLAAPQSMLSANRDSYRIGAEEFRTLRSSLELVRKQRPLKTLLVTSALPGEGKTFVAVNLAHTLAWRHDQRVLVIDGDLRLSRLHQCFANMPQEPGLADYLSGDVNPMSLIRRGPGSNFFVLPAGRTVPNALEVVGNTRLNSLIQWLAPAFDWIVIDSPPAVPVSDSRLIAEHADGILFVVRAGLTPSGLAKRAVRQIRGKRYLGVVLNGVEADPKAGSYYYGGKSDGAGRKQSS